MALGDAFRHIGLGPRIGPNPANGDDVQRAVCCSITASVEAMAGRLAGRSWDRAHAAKGSKAGLRLEPARTIESLLPHTLGEAVTLALAQHPSIQAALHAVDAAALQVKLVEGELYPTLNLVGNVQQNYNFFGIPGERLFNGSIGAQLSVPIYEGGEVYARARQAKETLGQARLQADLQRDLVRESVVSSWGMLDAARASIQSSKAAVTSAEIALDGVRQEAAVGQRTTFDILQQQQILLNARVSLVTAQRDRVVASYAVMSAIGRLSAANLNLVVVQYDPTIHFDQVKDKWIGLRTPDGR
jgi:outer membrane protein